MSASRSWAVRWPRWAATSCRWRRSAESCCSAATFAALAWANLAGVSYADVWSHDLTIGWGQFAISEDLLHWVNDGLMTVFFFVVGPRDQAGARARRASRPPHREPAGLGGRRRDGGSRAAVSGGERRRCRESRVGDPDGDRHRVRRGRARRARRTRAEAVEAVPLDARDRRRHRRDRRDRRVLLGRNRVRAGSSARSRVIAVHPVHATVPDRASDDVPRARRRPVGVHLGVGGARDDRGRRAGLADSGATVRRP